MSSNQHIPSGYKTSPLGPIPEDWEVKRLGEIFTFKNGVNAGKDSYGEGVRFVNTMDVLNNEYITGKILRGRVAINEKTKNEFLVSFGDVLFNRTSETREEVGCSTVYLDNEDAVFGGFVIRAHDIDAIILNPRFKQYCFQPSYIRNQISALGNGAIRYNLGQEDLSKVNLLIPTKVEQEAIVSVISLWDNAIAKQTALIEQLTLRKRGLMQQLLTGKKRLKGFSGEWKEVRLGEVGKFAGGCAFNEQEQGGHTGIPFYKVSDMNLSGNESKMNIANNYVTHEQIERLGYIVIEDEAIIFAKVGAAIALERKRYAKNFIIDNNMLAYIPSNNVWFMKYWFDSISLSKYIQVGALPSYNASDLSIIKLKMPSLKEQHAIASVLVNADKEIEIQKQKLAAMQEQKKGLMQVLLTGKRRVNNE